MKQNINIEAMTAKGLSSTCRGENNTNVNPVQKVTINSDGDRAVIISANSIRSTMREVLTSICGRTDATTTHGISVNRSRVRGGESSLAVTYKGTESGKIHDPQQYVDDLLGYLEIEDGRKEQRDSVFGINGAISLELFKNDRFMHQSPAPAHLQNKKDKKDNKNQMLFSEEAIYSAFRYHMQINTSALKDITKRSVMLRLFLQCVYELGHVGGNRARYYMEMQPLNVIIRTTDLATSNIPVFTSENDWEGIVDAIIEKRVDASEIIIAGPLFQQIPSDIRADLVKEGTKIYDNVYDAMSHVSKEYCGEGLYAR